MSDGRRTACGAKDLPAGRSRTLPFISKALALTFFILDTGITITQGQRHRPSSGRDRGWIARGGCRLLGRATADHTRKQSHVKKQTAHGGPPVASILTDLAYEGESLFNGALTNENAFGQDVGG